uniref:Uncharacterized protein n=1 Tax=viral metagenome TaxID=1070528 RepID=A0A6C0JFY0_9ZZZZ
MLRRSQEYIEEVTEEKVSEEEPIVAMFSFDIVKENARNYGLMFFELFGVYLFWIVLHYISAHLYASWCANLTLAGFLLSPFVVPAPHCQAFRWVINNGSNSITAMWLTLGTWCAKKIIG